MNCIYKLKIYVLGSITENTVSVLVNTIHFKAQWIHPFARTSKKNFHGFDGNNKIDMMYISDVKLRYKNDDELNAQLLEVPYEVNYILQNLNLERTCEFHDHLVSF